MTERRTKIGVRATRQRRAVEEILGTFNNFASAGDVHQAILAKGDKVGLTTVYRTLQALADAHEVDMLTNERGETLYRQCDDSGHHHHLVCTNCGVTVEIDGGPVEAWSHEMAKQHGFTCTGHTAEIFGLCNTCQ